MDDIIWIIGSITCEKPEGYQQRQIIDNDVLLIGQIDGLGSQAEIQINGKEKENSQ